MALNYPTAFAEIQQWSKDNGIIVVEGRTRFAQYAIIDAIARSRLLSDMLVFKGGNALDFIWQPNRSTSDLDFSVDMVAAGEKWNPETFAALLRDSLEPTLKTTELGVVLLIHRIDKQPPGPDKTFATYTVRVGYALQDQRALIARNASGLKSPQMIPA